MVYGDSLVVVNQVNKDWSCFAKSMDQYYAEVRKLKGKFQGIEFHHVDRDNKTDADLLSKLGSSRAKIPPSIFV